jgi:heavy metal sensor kinase
MKSIRLSLMVYFLALLAVALTAASLLVYRNAEQTLESKQQAMEQLIRAQYRERSRDEEARLDAALLAQATALASVVQVQFDWSRGELQPLYLLGLLSANLNPSAYALAPTWIAEGAPPPRTRSPQPPERPSAVYQEFRVRTLTGVKLKDEVLLPGDGQTSEYFQIDSPPGKSYFSPSLAGRSFTLDASVFEPDQLFSWVYDNPQLDRATPLRRVVLKTSGVNMASVGPGRRDPSRPPRPPRHGPTIYIHCAAETSKREAALAAFRLRRDAELHEVAVKSNESLRDLRNRLWGISLVIFAATGVGGFWLVRLGLSPLRRLSDAVSRISARDFRLPLDERPLPRELRPIVKRLTGTLDLLKRAFAREKQAAADISHELRTPLAALLTTTEFALRKPRSPEHYRELFGDCHTSAQQMNQIVERLLTLARLDAGVDRLRLQAVDVGALARDCAAVIRPLAEARGLTLTVKSPPPASSITTNGSNGDGSCLVQADPDKLREIVSNLLHNAIQYNRPGGTVDLRLARENGALEVEVRDTGIGIAPEARELIFERFYRADPSRGGDDLHTGLGLAIVKEYLDLMGGSIGVESTEGRGSTFRVSLPVH